jgi:DNA-directed RNA polymerase subunit beta
MEKILRKNFSRSQFELDLPNLLEVQINSFDTFLQKGVNSKDRKKAGLEQIFQDIFPITDLKQLYSLEYEGYSFGVPKYSIKECRERGLSYSVPLRAVLSLYVYEGEGEDRKFIEKITNDVFICELPMMTETGTFIINGAERVVVSQLHRSPGVAFDEEFHPSGKKLYKSRIIPARGSWVEFLIDTNDALYINIDRRRKVPASILIRALGFSENEKILELFYEKEVVSLEGIVPEDLEERVLFSDCIDAETGEVIAESNTPLTIAIINKLLDAGISEIYLIAGILSDNPVMHNTLAIDPTISEDEALTKIYSLIRPGDPPNASMARTLFEKLFFDDKRYDLGEVGRYRMNSRLGVNVDLDTLTMTNDDFLAIIRYMVSLFNGEGVLDDIDHLGNRRARSVGELLGNQFALGMTRMARAIRERLSLRDHEDLTPQDLINARTVSSVVATFFGSSQLSQFMDQTNPLSEVTHKRRMSALGPGGLTRERAGFEVRDVHYTHYGRLCPIETPEGPNIGLINSLATYSIVNPFGFIETPYRVVKDCKVTDEVIFVTADKEDAYRIAPSSTNVDDNGVICDDYVLIREKGDFPVVPKAQVELMDVAPKQIVSVAAGLIPFLEHDDANRALMGSNMQRQAVPLLRSEAPVVGTGVEEVAALDSGTVIRAKNSGEVAFVDAGKVVVKRDPAEDDEERFLEVEEYDTYEMRKYERSNQDTSINQKPVVETGWRVEQGDVIADGASTQNGELALGKNILIGFVPWNGYNFEDAIIISENIVKDDVFTSIHIEEFELEVRDTKRGPEELTREIPNVSEESLKNLDDRGIIRVGAEIEAGDILVGKITPKGETELSPEERLLRAIFGEKAGDVRDSSLKAPPGMKGVIVDTRVFSRKERDKKTKEADKSQIEAIKEDIGGRIQEVIAARDEKLLEVLSGATSGEVRDGSTNEVIVPAGKTYSEKILTKINFSDLTDASLLAAEENLNEKASKIVDDSNEMIKNLEYTLDKEIDKVVRGDELKPGVLKLVKVYVAKKRRLQVGDKMAGRHGNKGVISKVVPIEDMPFTEDGRPLEILLNPLGVPSRMNVGQVLEVHLGWAAKTMGHKIEALLEAKREEALSEIRTMLERVYTNPKERSWLDNLDEEKMLQVAKSAQEGIPMATPVFDGASYDDVVNTLDMAERPKSGKTRLVDGRTGEFFDTPVTIGYMYMLKLGHLVDDKMHARSIGPYSLVTQQPLGGKSQFGGQRFGEMEVWALEAYGAAYTLQELLTVKSDDVMGRSKIYESIVKGENTPDPGIPESFNVLIKEIQALGLDIKIGGGS